MRLGTPSRVEDDVADGRAVLQNGMSCSSMIFEMTPLLPWRPASLSPSEILRFLATNTRTRSSYPRRQVVPVLARERHDVDDDAASPWGTFSEQVSGTRAPSP